MNSHRMLVTHWAFAAKEGTLWLFKDPKSDEYDRFGGESLSLYNIRACALVGNNRATKGSYFAIARCSKVSPLPISCACAVGFCFFAR